MKSKSQKQQQQQQLKHCKINGYTAVSYKNPSVATLNASIYLREHSTAENELPKLFIANLPWPPSIGFKRGMKLSDDQITNLKQLIKQIIPGSTAVTDVFPIGETPTLAARLTHSDIDSVLTHPNDHVYLQGRDKLYGDGDRNLVQNWVSEHEDERNVKSVQQWSDSTMKGYEAREKVEKEDKARKRLLAAVPDADGFVTVVGGGAQVRAKDLIGKDGDVGKSGIGLRRKKGNKGQGSVVLESTKGIEKTGFYRWQRKNENALGELRNKFKDDRKRVAAIQRLHK